MTAGTFDIILDIIAVAPENIQGDSVAPERAVRSSILKAAVLEAASVMMKSPARIRAD